MYRLVSTYSLVKPPKGSNVSGGDLVEVLLKIKDIKNIDERRSQWDAQIDMILDRNSDALYDAAKILEDHDYFKCTFSDYVLAYVSGFVVRKSKRFIKHKVQKQMVPCEECLSTLIFDKKKDEEPPEFFKLIHLKSRGYLYEPSLPLFSLISMLEEATLKVIQKNDINSDTLFAITDAIEKLGSLPMRGYDEHKRSLTHKIITFFLTTRMFFISKQINKNESIEKERTKEKRKLSKLATENTENEKAKNTKGKQVLKKVDTLETKNSKDKKIVKKGGSDAEPAKSKVPKKNTTKRKLNDEKKSLDAKKRCL